MKLQETEDRRREAASMELYKNDKNFRADRLVAAWSKIPEIGVNLKKLPLQEARNVAINLDRQCGWMQSLRESQLSTALNDFTPENMLRLVRLAMPNIIRNKVFSEFALETTKDSIKYIRPFFSKTANGHPLNDKAQDYDGTQGKPGDDYDPWGYSKGGEFNGSDFRKALYEDTRDRTQQELANAIIGTSDGAGTYDFSANAALGADNKIAIAFKDMTGLVPGNPEAEFASKKWGTNGSLYVDGYTYLYYVPAAQLTNKKYLESGALEQNVIGLQDKGSGQFFCAPGFDVQIKKSPTVRDKFLVAPPKLGPGNAPTGAQWNDLVGTDGPINGLDSTGIFDLEVTLTDKDGNPATSAADNPAFGGKLVAFGRYNSESDFEGNYLGEVEIRMDEFTFKPSPTAIGVSWSQMTEITLDTSFNISAEETLVTYASQEIRSALDYRAIRLAYAIAKTNSTKNPNYTYEFDAHWAINQSLEGYIANAQTFVNALDAIGDVMYDEINRGGVSRLVGGPAACSYMHLNSGYSAKGLQNQNGSYQFGELDGRPLFKVPSSIIPPNEILCVWKNDAVENDVSIAFGTLIPFFSTGIIQRKNFYKEAGLATYGDWAVLNRRYLALIRIVNLKDAGNAGARFSKPTQWPQA